MWTLYRTRWVVAVTFVLLSSMAIISEKTRDSADQYGAGSTVNVGQAGSTIGSAGLGGLLALRLAGTTSPKPWRVYVDRFEFTYVTLLWALWTSATMAYSAGTISSTLCQASPLNLPKCTSLTFDLILLHSLSLVSFAYLVIILSTVLGADYYNEHSNISSDNQWRGSEGVGGDTGSVFVMWELAIGSRSPSPQPGHKKSQSKSYGTLETDTSTAENPYVTTPQETVQAVKLDKFSRGRKALYVPLGLCSAFVVALTGFVTAQGNYALSNILVACIALASVALVSVSLHLETSNTQNPQEIDSSVSRKRRVVEAGALLALFVAWPIAAITYTLYPSTEHRPCSIQDSTSLTNPPAINLSSLFLDVDEDGDITTPETADLLSLCNVTMMIVSLSWVCSWITLARLAGLIFPSPKVENGLSDLSGLGRSQGVGEEGRPLMGGSPSISGNAPGKGKKGTEKGVAERPQVKWGRLVAGEAFELGGDDDDDNDD